jgi:hypothetical protein
MYGRDQKYTVLGGKSESKRLVGRWDMFEDNIKMALKERMRVLARFM